MQIRSAFLSYQQFPRPKRQSFIHTVIGAVLVALAMGAGILMISAPPRADARAVHNVRGWAWSDNVGWISFNSLDCDADDNGRSDGSPSGCPPAGSTIHPYGVTIDETNGLFTGFAWSDSVGWLAFTPGDLIGCPRAPCEARADTATGFISGWARAISSNDATWDGWIELADDWDRDGVVEWSPVATGGDDTARTGYPTGDFGGYAWGGDVMGWIALNVGVTFTGTFNRPPIAIDDGVDPAAEPATITVIANENHPVTVPVLVNDTDPDGDPLAVVATGVPGNGTTVITGVPPSGFPPGAGRTIEYTPTIGLPNTGFAGVDTFNYTIADPGGLSDDAIVEVTVYDCGDGVRDPGPFPEECDCTDFTNPATCDFGGETCRDYSFIGGPLSCRPDCTAETLACHGFREVEFKEF